MCEESPENYVNAVRTAEIYSLRFICPANTPNCLHNSVIRSKGSNLHSMNESSRIIPEYILFFEPPDLEKHAA